MDRLHKWFVRHQMCVRTPHPNRYWEVCASCRTQRIRFECVRCLRLGRRIGVCSEICMKTFQAFHESEEHTCSRPRPEYETALCNITKSLNNQNLLLHGLSCSQKKLVWTDIVLHLQRKLGLVLTVGYTAVEEETKNKL